MSLATGRQRPAVRRMRKRLAGLSKTPLVHVQGTLDSVSRLVKG